MKKTLNESTVRRFMKLAHIDGLTENFVTSTVQEGDTDTTYEENMDLDVEEEVPDLEGDLPLDLDPETVETIVDAVVSAIGDVTNTDTSVTSTGGPVGDLEDDALEDEAEAVFDGEQAVDVADDEIVDDLDDELVDGDLEEGSVKGDVSKTHSDDDKDPFDYEKGDVGGEVVEDKKGGKDWHATGKKKGQKGAHDRDTDYSGHGMRAGDKPDTGPGDKDDTWRKGEKSKTHPGRLNRESLNQEDAFLSEITRRVAARLMSLTEEE